MSLLLPSLYIRVSSHLRALGVKIAVVAEYGG